MALASQLSHKLLMSTALPYRTFTTPIDQDPHYIAGRNVMINSRSYCAMRPGFTDFLEPVPTTFHHLVRLYSWARWDSSYFIMAVDHLPSGQMAVFKFKVGTDNSFEQIILEPTPASGIPYSFATANNYLFISNPSDCHKWTPEYGLQNWGIPAPTAAPGVTIAAGTGAITAANGGYNYLITYGDSFSGHESSPSPVSDPSTGNFSRENLIISWPTTPPDGQIDVVNIYRTTDGGSENPQQMAFVAQVPIANSPYTDSTIDDLLSAVRFAPAYYQNDPPMPMSSLIVYAGRIWGIVGTRVWYSGQEEISNGVPQECFPGASLSSLDGNFYAYETKVTALAPMTDGVAVFVPNRIQKIEGDSLDTFRRYMLLDKRGTTTEYTVKAVGQSILWFDRSNQVWLSDQGEIGRDIRPDLAKALLPNVQAAIHIFGEQHWILLLDPDNSLLYVYDLDLGGWNVPWTVSATCVESIDVSLGVTRLAAAINGQVRLENPGLCLDAGAPYTAYAITNSLSLAPDSNPDLLGVLHHVAIESNEFQPFVAVKMDEDAAVLNQVSTGSLTGGFNTLWPSTDPPLRRNGAYLIQKNYMANPDPGSPACRRCSLRLDWQRQPDVGAPWALYSIDLAMTPLGR